MPHTYTMKYRPPDSFTAPRGFRILASGRSNPLPQRADLPRSDIFPFGVIAYDRELTEQELEAFEITPVPEVLLL